MRRIALQSGRVSVVVAVLTCSVSMPCFGEAAPKEAGGEEQSVVDAVAEYCGNISDKAAELRSARQAAILKELEVKLDDKIKLLEERRDELKTWIDRQESIRTAAEQGLVEIYAGMDPEVAAQQMEKLGLRLASSVLRQLKPRQASMILNEMKPEQAANMVKIIAAATKQEANPK